MNKPPSFGLVERARALGPLMAREADEIERTRRLTPPVVSALIENVPALFVTLEMDRYEVTERLLAIETGVSVHAMRAGTLRNEHVRELISAKEAYRKKGVIIADRPGQSVSYIASNARRLKRRHKVGLVLIDYLQLITPDSTKDPRYEQISRITRRLKLLARELQMPVVVLAQLNREMEKRPDRLVDARRARAAPHHPHAADRRSAQTARHALQGRPRGLPRPGRHRAARAVDAGWALLRARALAAPGRRRV